MDASTALELLRELALDLRWSWNHASDALWQSLDPELWVRTRNPCVMLKGLSAGRLAKLLEQAGFRDQLQRLADARRQRGVASAWFQRAYPNSAVQPVAYFSMEFMLSEALPIYAGGLGNVAGDQLKAASDLGIPIVGVGLLYQQGYFRQLIGQDGSQQALWPYNDPDQLPIAPARGADGEELRIELAMPGYPLWLRVWEVMVGRVRLYLLDSNDLANPPVARGITAELYGGDAELRLRQELVLGIGGWRLLEALRLETQVCHLNEGHAAFAVLERARAFMQSSGVAFPVALTATRAGNVFTTHTAVPAGFDRFAPQLIERYLGRYAVERLHLPVRELLALGRADPTDEGEPFNMAYLAVRGSGAVNGVSRLHGAVSRRIFQPLFTRWPEQEVPIGHITNGIHTPSWDSEAADQLWTEVCGQGRWLDELQWLEADMRRATDEQIWRCRAQARGALVHYARERLAAQLESSGAPPESVEAARHVFDPQVLTIGFSRRFAAYKRPNLLLSDPERLVRLLTHPERPVQLILAGKAHPADVEGQRMVREWVQFVRRPDVRAHAVFLADHDMLMAEQLVQGVDLWINTPRRPWEACGTSGMKVLVNGGINLSEIDGWWAEAFTPQVGWALGDGREHDHDAAWDAVEAAQLLELLESRAVPEFYARDARGFAPAWIARVRESMATLTATYSANRSIRDYLEQCYLPAAAGYLERVSNGAEHAAQIATWYATLQFNWPALRFGRVSVETLGDRHLFRGELFLGALRPQALSVQLYAEPSSAAAAPVRELLQPRGPVQADGALTYEGFVPATRPADDYTLRVVPSFPGIGVPLEAPFILWQR